MMVVQKESESIIKILSPKLEYQLFCFILIQEILSLSLFESQKLVNKFIYRLNQYYRKAKSENVHFYQFQEWLNKQIKLVLFDRDKEFQDLKDKPESPTRGRSKSFVKVADR